MSGQLFNFFATATENKRIAALEAQYTFAFFGQSDQALIDLLLRQCVLGALFAHIDTFSIAAAQLDNRRRYQAVVQHHIGLLHQAQGTEGQQVRVTRPGAN